MQPQGTEVVMDIYLGARYSRHPEMQHIAEELCTLGHTVTSRWIEGSHDVVESDPTQQHSDRVRFAVEDLADLMRANCHISFTETPGSEQGRGRGGRHVEF